MAMIMKKILLASLLALTALTALAAKPIRHLDQIEAKSRATVQGDRLDLQLDLILDNLKVGTNDLIILTPRIAQPDGSYSLLLDPIYIVGGTRDRVLSRQIRFDNLPDYYETARPESITRRLNGKRQQITYRTSVPYDRRMRGAQLTLEEWLTGCAECDRGTASMALMTPMLKSEPYKPTYKASFIVPEAEPVKNRSDKYSATIAFRLDRDQIDRTYKDNARILGDVDAKVRSVLDNKDITLTGMTVEGWASPEGNAAYNQKLSERRAKAFADYLSSTHGIRRADMRVTGRGEDWTGVERLIADSDLSYKADLQQILDNYSGDARDPRIRALQGGQVFRDLVDGLYTRVRRTDYTFAYTVRGFNLEEARERIRTSPRLLSLNEMFLVAESYSPESKEYKEVFDIAATYFPTEPVAVNNVAAAELEQGNFTAALSRLERLQSETAQSLNNRAIALALSGKLADARQLFEQAKARGDKNATENLRELEKLEESLK